MDAIAGIGKTGGRTKLTPEEVAEVAQMAARDREVRAQETARMAAAGLLANGVDYVYAQGPDGKMYAIAGKVRINMMAGQTAEATLAEARQIQAAVSGADMVVQRGPLRGDARGPTGGPGVARNRG